MDALEEDHDFLTAGDVFTDDLIETWIGLKRDEIDQARLARPRSSTSSTSTSEFESLATLEFRHCSSLVGV